MPLRRVLIGLLASIAAACGAGAPSSGAGDPPPGATPVPLHPLGDPSEGVGAATCAACHADIAANQANHPMALTAAAVAPTSRDRWFSDEMLARAVHWPEALGAEPAYRAEGDGVRFETPGSDRRAVAVDAVFGSGLRGLTPVSFAPERRMRELRLSFSRAQDGWFPTPGGEDDPDPLGDLDSAEASADCLGCHATALAWDAENRFDAHQAVLGVTCERCHGPGAAHIEAQSAGESGGIFHPGLLAPREQVAFCGQCHRQPTDFEPQQILARDPGLARHAGASLMMSACFRESPPDQAITCTDCHDPHRPDPATPARTRAVCLRCHQAPGTIHGATTAVAADGGDCASCHLPTERDAFHGTPFTDHWIRRPGEPAPTPASARGRADLAWLEALYEARVIEPSPPEKTARLRTGLAELLHLRGVRERSQRLLAEAVAGSPDYETRVKAGALLRDGGRVAEALAAFREAAVQRPEKPHAFFELGDLLLAQGNSDAAIEPLTAAARLSPDSAGVRTALGRALLGGGRPAEAVLALEEALAIEPDTPAALGPLIGILAAHPRRDLRDPPEALRLAERLAGRFSFGEPRSLDLLGAAYAATGDFANAIRAAERAADLSDRAGAPDHAAAVRERLALYRARRPWVGSLPTSDAPPR